MRTCLALILVAAVLWVNAYPASAQPAEPTPGATVVLRGQIRPPGAPQQSTLPPDTPSPSDTPQDTPQPTGTDMPAATATTQALPTTPSADPPTVPPTVPVPPPSDQDRPILRVKKTHVDPSPASPGGEVRLRIEVENVGRRDAEHVQLSLASTAFHAIGQGAVLYKEEIDAGETRPFEARLRADSAAVSGVYQVSIGLRWDVAGGGAFEDQSSIGIEIVSHRTSRPAVVVTSSQVPSRCMPGIPFSVAFSLQNNGGQEARNIVLAPVAGPLALAGGESPPVNLAPGASATVAMRMVASETVEPGANSQTLEIRYDDPDGQRLSDTTVFGISVTSDRMLLPQPMVTRYTVGARGTASETLNPGQVFELMLEIQNVGSRDAANTRLALGGGSSSAQLGSGAGGAQLGVFAPLETSNVRFVGSLAAGATQVLRQRMVVDGGAKPGVYTLEVAFSFTDADGEEMATSEVISLLVSRRVSLEVNPVLVITDTLVGDETPLSVEIVNAGSASVNVGNAEAVAEGGIEVIDGTLFIGPIDGGSVYPFDVTLLGVSAGDAEVTVVLNYTDDFGQPQTYERSFEMVVNEAPEMPMEADLPTAQKDESLIARILRGLFGLGASPSVEEGTTPAIGESISSETILSDDGQPVERNP